MIYGLDVSTSIVGFAQFTNDGKFVRADHVDLRKTDGILAKADALREFINGLAPMAGFYRDDENYVFVEERLGNFAAGKTMLQTLMKLAAFNAIATYIMWRHENSTGKHRAVVHIHPSTWKSLLKKEGLFIPKGSKDKKELTLSFVRRKEPDFEEIVRLGNLNKNGNPHPWCYDMADAYCIGRAGYLRICTERGSSQPSGTPSETMGGKKVKR